MKTQTITLYTAQELKDKFPAAFARALERHQGSVSESPLNEYGVAEIMQSLKGVIKAAGLKMDDWNIGAYSPSSLVVSGFDNSDAVCDFVRNAADFKRARAMAWLENNLFAKLRIPWLPYTKDGKRTKRAEYRGYGAEYSPGLIKPCPVTGMCYDDNFINALKMRVELGCTLRRAFEALADEARKMMEAEDEYQRSEEYFLDICAADDRMFTESGKEWRE